MTSIYGQSLNPGVPTQCLGVNSRGKPCRAAVAPGEQYCRYHGPSVTMPIPPNTPMTPEQQRSVPIAGFICNISTSQSVDRPTESIGLIVRLPRKER